MGHFYHGWFPGEDRMTEYMHWRIKDKSKFNDVMQAIAVWCYGKWRPDSNRLVKVEDRPLVDAAALFPPPGGLNACGPLNILQIHSIHVCVLDKKNIILEHMLNPLFVMEYHWICSISLFLLSL